MSESVAPRDTIAAISTAAGGAAIALVRLSGESAIKVADAIFRGHQPPSAFVSHTQHVGEIVQDGRAIDQVMIAVHRGPASYTGEDLVEISCHGGAFVSAKVLQTCLDAGARAARPGEFTERAYLNGKMDLTQAEAVVDLIRAQTDLALRSATEQLSGRLGNEFIGLRSELIEILAHVEAGMDFPEEGISPASVSDIEFRLRLLQERVERMIATAETGRLLREGLRVVIFGATNAGKSSLLNRLIGFDRAIVSESHGTTRDTIEEQLNLRGIVLRLFDTAGLRPADSEIEREGMLRTARSLEMADLRLHVVDANAPRPHDFCIKSDEILVLNKSDLPEHSDWSESVGVRISCKTGAGLSALEDEVFERAGAWKITAESAIAINVRHADRLRRTNNALSHALSAIASGATPEIFAVDLRAAHEALDELLGRGDEEAVRDAVFSQFCIGK